MLRQQKAESRWHSFRRTLYKIHQISVRAVITVCILLLGSICTHAQKSKDYSTYSGGRYCFSQRFKSIRDLPAFSEFDSLPDGKWVQLYPDGSLAGEYTMKKHVLEGPAKCYYTSGRIRYEFTFRSSYIHGLFKEYYESGELFKRYNYFDGFLDGKWQMYYKDGTLWAEGKHKNEMLEGEYILYWSNGKIKEERLYKDNKMAGRFVRYYENGTLECDGFQEGEYGTKTGNWTYYYENGQKHKEVRYEKNQQEIMINAWDRKGVQMVKEGNGKYIQYSQLGKKLMEGNYSAGLQQGKWHIFNPDNNSWSEVNYLDGKTR